MSGLSSPVDIRPDHLEIVQDILRKHLPTDVKVWVFGSRANWTTKDSSDLDLAVEGVARLDSKIMSALEMAFEESDLPYFVDVVDLNTVGDAFKKIVEVQKTPFPLGGDDTTAKAADGWREVTLGDLVEIKHGYAFKGKFIQNEPQKDILLTPGNFAIGGGFKGDRFKYYDGPVEEEYVLQEGDLIVTMTDLSKQSDTLGYPAMVPASPQGHRYLHNQRLGKVLFTGSGELDARYVFYLLCSTEYRHEILASSTGTAVKHTSPDKIRQYRFELPTPPEQRAIAHVLGTLDDKIELNRQMNETLEAMARALFKSWFVDFEPVRAKMEGRWRRGESLPGLPADMYDAFPERLAPSELGEIPEGWGVGTISQLSERIFNGGTPKRSESAYWEDGDVPWLTSGEVRQPFILDTQSFITEKGLKESSAKMVPERAILVALYGATAGQVSLNYRPLTTNQAISAIIPKDDCRYYCFVNLKLRLSELQEMAVGSAQQNLSKKMVETTALLLPPVHLRARFNELVGVLFDSIFENLEESHTLIEQRDALLPGLVGGEVRVGEW